MHHPLPNYLRTHRKRWSLTQDELAHLLGLTAQVAISQYELNLRRPGADILIGSEVIFGTSIRELFPQVYDQVADAVLARAKALYGRLEARNDLSASMKLRLLSDMLQRADGDIPQV